MLWHRHSLFGAIAVRGGVMVAPLFSVDVNFAESLEQRLMPAELADIFREKGYPLPPKVTVRDIFICDYTRIFPEDFEVDSICPNGETFREYPNHRTFEELMRARYPARY